MTGAVYGTPAAAGSTSVTVEVTDSGTPQQTATAALSLTVNPPPGTLAVATASLPGGSAGAVYPATALQATGGTPPYNWSVASGSLPTGLSLRRVSESVYTAVYDIVGTPAAVGTSFFRVQATDATGHAASRLLALFVSHPGVTVTGSSAGATGSGGGGTGTPDTTVAAGGGTGAVATAQYGDDPEPGATPDFSSAGAYFDVAVEPASTFSTLTITRCGAGGGDTLQW